MAMMKYREDNMARWLGVRPGHQGQQIDAHKANLKNTTQILYTVPANTVFCLCNLWSHVWRSAGGTAYIVIKDGDAALKHYLWRCEDDGAGNIGNSQNYVPPFEIIEDWYIEGETNNDVTEMSFGINGFIIPA